MLQPKRCLYFLLLCAASLTVSACASSGPVGFWSRNRTDRAGERQGPWRTYHDADNTKIATKGRFRHGQQVGRGSYYTAEGNLVEREWFRRRTPELVRIRYYYPDGKLYRAGQGRYVNEPDGMHFYWFGDWQVYDTAGNLVKIETYEVGRLAKAVQLHPKP